MTDVTRILAAIDGGDQIAAARLLPLVYDELRKLAAVQMAREKPGHTLDATALVHEAYLRLVRPSRDRERADAPPLAHGRGSDRFAGSGHFFAAAAEAMRRILVEQARRKKSLKRGGGLARQELDPDRVAAPEASDDLLALDEALARLAAGEPQIAELVNLRYFAGMTIPEAAKVLGVAPRTADAWWAYARAWLRMELQDADA
jgi:RNA polymerase sigma factor (TIGR02999 family)